MKKTILALYISSITILHAQTANRFFYELTYKPKLETETKDKVMTILDITDKKSVYEDFTMRSQDSIVKNIVETAEKSGQKYDLSTFIKLPKFEHKITKLYPEMQNEYIVDLAGDFFAYTDNIKFNWKIDNQKEKIGEYNTQKATVDFGGRKWTAWFSTEIPFQDGPYKFYGLPGLIVKIEDSGRNYSWVLQGNKKVENYDETCYTEKMLEKQGLHFTIIPTTKEKFEKARQSYQSDPLRGLRQRLTPEMMNQMVEGQNKTWGEMFKEEEKMEKERINSKNNPIELPIKKQK